MLGARGEVTDRDLVLDAVTAAIEIALTQPGQIENGLTQGLGGDGAGVDAHPTDHVAAIDDPDALAQLCGSDGSLLPTGPGAQDQQVVVIHKP